MISDGRDGGNGSDGHFFSIFLPLMLGPVPLWDISDIKSVGCFKPLVPFNFVLHHKINKNDEPPI